jgi:hypothetical protein
VAPGLRVQALDQEGEEAGHQGEHGDFCHLGDLGGCGAPQRVEQLLTNCAAWC